VQATVLRDQAMVWTTVPLRKAESRKGTMREREAALRATATVSLMPNGQEAIMQKERER